MSYLLGSIGFLLMFFYDFNQIRWGKKAFTLTFFAGFFLVFLSVAVAMAQDAQWQHLLSATGIIAGIFALTFAVLLLYTLFFALPFQDTYQSRKSEPSLCKTGMYALCRHPGVLWLFSFLLFAALAVRSMTLFYLSVFLTLWNVLYVLFQDNVTFVHLFKEYPQYKRETPFLIPNKKSIRISLKH